MNYKKVYVSIIEKAKSIETNRVADKKIGFYFEKHHIKPVSLGGNNDADNIVLLTAREHFICHWLLAKFYEKNGNISEYCKMAAAFMQMCRCKNGDHIRNSHAYQWARQIWSKFMKENHWAYSDEWKKSQSIRMKEYYRQNPMPRKVHILEDRICECGCNNTFTVKVDTLQKYIHGHNSRQSSKETNKKRSDSIKTHLSSLTIEELSLRSKNSFGSCDHIARGKKISEGKKGKRSTQKEILGKKFAVMSDNEFENYLNNKGYSISIRKRYITYRNFYIDNRSIDIE